MLCEARDSEGTAARACGLTRDALRHLRGLLSERGRTSWEIGDVLVAALGPPGPAVIHDGSTERLERLADLLGCSRQWLGACRATSAAWPVRERRPSVAWAVSRALVARPDRVRLLDRFVDECERAGTTPSLARLTEWLDRRDRRPTLGRPRADPVEAVERAALRLDHEALVRLVDRLAAVLALTAVA